MCLPNRGNWWWRLIRAFIRRIRQIKRRRKSVLAKSSWLKAVKTVLNTSTALLLKIWSWFVEFNYSHQIKLDKIVTRCDYSAGNDRNSFKRYYSVINKHEASHLINGWIWILEASTILLQSNGLRNAFVYQTKHNCDAVLKRIFRRFWTFGYHSTYWFSLSPHRSFNPKLQGNQLSRPSRNRKERNH